MVGILSFTTATHVTAGLVSAGRALLILCWWSCVLVSVYVLVSLPVGQVLFEMIAFCASAMVKACLCVGRGYLESGIQGPV